MFSFFNRPLPASLYSSSTPAEYGHVELGLNVPNDVQTGSPVNPDGYGTADGFGADLQRGRNVAQETNPGYAGVSEIHLVDAVGVAPDTGVVKNDLTYQRYDGAVPVHFRHRAGQGPVTGANNEWSGNRTALAVPVSNPGGGAVKGGPDYAKGVQAAYAAEQYSAISAAQSAAALVAAL